MEPKEAPTTDFAKMLYPILFVLCILAGVGLGVGGLRAYSRLTAAPQAARRPIEPAPDTAKQAPSNTLDKATPTSTAADQKPGQPVAGAQPPATQTAPNAQAKPADAVAAKTEGKTAQKTPPMDPLSGFIGLNPLPAVQPDGPAAKPTPPPPDQFRLVEFLMQGADAARVTQIAREHNATAKAFTEYQGEKRLASDGVLIIVPTAKTPGLMDALAKAGATVSLDWKGENADRHRLLTEKATTALQELQRKRQELLVRYYEDAAPVRDLDEQISAVADALRKFNDKSAAKADVVKVSFSPS